MLLNCLSLIMGISAFETESGRSIDDPISLRISQIEHKNNVLRALFKNTLKLVLIKDLSQDSALFDNIKKIQIEYPFPVESLNKDWSIEKHDKSYSSLESKVISYMEEVSDDESKWPKRIYIKIVTLNDEVITLPFFINIISKGINDDAHLIWLVKIVKRIVYKAFKHINKKE